ncbi:MAG: GGDEF domain-containing protein [Desulfobulbaceae bacterium]|nr:GGDEF domain-containing protein [Desulfobulbaceae bacterium]MCK5543738.1 GGDEF domain-containing protein [Desulfobulbaceae bacterium]
MTENDQISDVLSSEYIGNILSGNYSAELKNRVAECIAAFRSFDKTGPPVIPYISAWQENEKQIWYEYVGGKFPLLLDCSVSEIAQVFRESVIDRRVYKYQDVDDRIKEVVIPHNELGGHRKDLRAEGKKSGAVDAVYKLAVPYDKIVWLKDQANVEKFEQDNICISLGCLTVVTMEMELKSFLERIGYLDELTQLPKRNALLRLLDMNIGQMQRKQINDFVFLMIDIDYFKSVNDTYGHQAGDHVLQTLAEVMIAMKRKADEIGRYGGEEFCALSAGNIRNGFEFAERLRRRIEGALIEFNDHKISITVSVGVASASELTELTADKLIERADKRLYLAKQRGRNRVVWSDGPDE